MAKDKTAFDILLESLPEDEFEFKGSMRKAMADIADKVPVIRDSVLMQSDYSKKMDELRDRVKLADDWDTWTKENWLVDKKMTKAEQQKQQLIDSNQLKIDELTQELETARQAAVRSGDDMTFEQLNEALKGYKKTEGLITKADLDSTVNAEKANIEKYVQGNTGAMVHAALTAGDLNLRHFKEFGEPFKAAEFIKSATEKGRFDLEDYYEKDFVLAKRQERQQADHAAQLKAKDEEIEKVRKEAEERGKAEALKTQTMGANGGIVDMGNPEVGPLQRQMMPQQQAEGETPKAPEVPIGDGSIAAFAARQFNQKQAAGR